MKPNPARGDVWLTTFDPVRENEQGGTRPAVIVSADIFNSGGARRVIAVPITTRERRLPLHVPITPPEGGLRQPSFAKCEDIRSITIVRLLERWGSVSSDTIAMIEDRLRTLLDL
ncbi:MAG: type II toxin-antitoxin system PemK/MazF family toxin [Chloroflexota bacterium]|nr:type II toxin-antitoxin system PemK/MazF family toxin [Chloroflexota bacterium]